MPRLIHSNPKYRKHQASGQARVTIDGKDIYLGPYGTRASRREYDRVIGEWLASGRRLPGKGSDMTVPELLAAYWRHAKSYYDASKGKHFGELGAVRVVIRIIKRLYSDTLVRDFGPLALKAVREEMIKEGWCRKYVNHQVSRIRRLFRWGVAQEPVPASVLHGLEAVEGLMPGKTDARESEAVRPVPDDLVDPILTLCSAQVEGRIELQRLTGMRPGEVCAMRGCDIDTTGPLWVYRPASHKTQYRGHRREVYLGPKAKQIVEKFLKPDLQAHLFSPADAEAQRRAAASEARKTPLSCGNRPRQQPHTAPASSTRHPLHRDQLSHSVADPVSVAAGGEPGHAARTGDPHCVRRRT